MTKRTLMRCLLLSASLATVGCGVPKEYAADRDHLNAALEAFAKAAQEVSQVGGGSPARMTPTLRDSLLRIVGRGLASADSIGDPFLEWLEPELRGQFRDKLIAGERLMLAAILAEDSSRLTRAEQLLGEWERYWRQHGARIAAKADL